MDGQSWIIAVLAVPAIAAGLYGLDRVALWLEARGLLYYRKRKPEGGGAGILGAMQEICEPSIKHVLHVKDEKRTRRRGETGQDSGEEPMHVLDLTLPSLEENLALDEALLLEAEAGPSGEVLRLWEWQSPAIILGAGGRLSEDVDEAACQAAGVPILRRSSGGGTVLLGSGCLLFSLVLSYDRSPLLREIRSSYCDILGRVRDALADLRPGITCAGTSDLAADGLKFSGNAQQRKRHHLLHHGTLLYAFDVQAMSRYLRMPTRQPDYRSAREHETFVRNLPTDAGDLKRRLCGAWEATTASDSWPRELVRQLVSEKYGKEEWNRRR